MCELIDQPINGRNALISINYEIQELISVWAVPADLLITKKNLLQLLLTIAKHSTAKMWKAFWCFPLMQQYPWPLCKVKSKAIVSMNYICTRIIFVETPQRK